MTPPIRRLVIDILKPHEPGITEFAREITDNEGVNALNADLIETDREVENIKITIEGEDIDQHEIENTIDQLGGTLHSIDQVVCGEKMVEQTETMQDQLNP